MSMTMSAESNSSNGRAKTPPLVRSQMASMLADATREIDGLKHTLSVSTSSRVTLLEDRLRKAEDRAQKAESELAKVVGMWGQLKVYLDAMEVRSRDARVGFDRIIEGVGIATGLGFADFGDVEQHSPVYAPAHTTGKHPRDSEFDALQEPNAPTAPPPKKRRRKTAQNESTLTTAPAQAPKAVPLSASSSAISVDVEEMLLNATSHEDKRQKRRASSVSSSFSIPQQNPYPPMPSTPPATVSVFPTHNAEGLRLCRQCGVPGKYKDGKCTEKWGAGPLGPGTLCSKCKRKLKKAEQQLSQHHVEALPAEDDITTSQSQSTLLSTPRVIRHRGPSQTHSHSNSPHSAAHPQHAYTPSPPDPQPKPELDLDLDIDRDVEMLSGIRDDDDDELRSSPARAYSHGRSQSAHRKASAPPTTSPPPPSGAADYDPDLDLLEAVDAAEASSTRSH